MRGFQMSGVINGETAITRQDMAFALHAEWPAMSFALDDIEVVDHGAFLGPVPSEVGTAVLAGMEYAATTVTEEGDSETLSSVIIPPPT